MPPMGASRSRRSDSSAFAHRDFFRGARFGRLCHSWSLDGAGRVSFHLWASAEKLAAHSGCRYAEGNSEFMPPRPCLRLVRTCRHRVAAASVDAGFEGIAQDSFGVSSQKGLLRGPPAQDTCLAQDSF